MSQPPSQMDKTPAINAIIERWRKNRPPTRYELFVHTSGTEVLNEDNLKKIKASKPFGEVPGEVLLNSTNLGDSQKSSFSNVESLKLLEKIGLKVLSHNNVQFKSDRTKMINLVHFKEETLGSSRFSAAVLERMTDVRYFLEVFELSTIRKEKTEMAYRSIIDQFLLAAVDVARVLDLVIVFDEEHSFNTRNTIIKISKGNAGIGLSGPLDYVTASYETMTTVTKISVCVIEAKNKLFADKTLDSAALHQVLAQAAVVLTAKPVTGNCIPFILSDGYMWVFGTLRDDDQTGYEYKLATFSLRNDTESVEGTDELLKAIFFWITTKPKELWDLMEVFKDKTQAAGLSEGYKKLVIEERLSSDEAVIRLYQRINEGVKEELGIVG